MSHIMFGVGLGFLIGANVLYPEDDIMRSFGLVLGTIWAVGSLIVMEIRRLK
jgi:hypothetical protein